MAEWSRFLSAAGGRRIIMGLGGLYVVFAVGYPLIPGAEDGASVRLVVAVLTGGPGLALLYGGYRLPRTNVRPELFPTVARWCVGGTGVILGILVFTTLAAGISSIVENVLILGALGSIAGFVAGTYDARAKTRERDLQETVEQLRTSNERLEQFAYAASHDLQEPLRMVSSYLQLVERRYGDELDEDGREFIDFAVNGADRMRTMVGKLLEYSRVTNRGAPLEPTEVEAVLDAVLDDFGLLIEETDATITTDDLPTVDADANQLEQLFQNLLSNAMKHGGEDAPTVHVGVERLDDAWQFSVADEGTGIDPAYHDRIFNVFEQLHREEELEARSVGIGLALCERIVERHDGEMWVESEPGEGATFFFTLPRSHESRPAVPTQLPSQT